MILITLNTAHLNVLLNVHVRKKDMGKLSQVFMKIKYFRYILLNLFHGKKCHLYGQNTYVPENCFATGAVSKKRKILLWQSQMANVLYLIKKSFLITQQVKRTKEKKKSHSN